MKNYDFNNIFAKILKGEIKASKIYENDDVLAFHDAYPKAKVHALIIPKKAYVDLNDFLNKADSIEVANYFKAIQEVVKALNIEETGYRVISNCGKDANQEVMHLHFHILAGENLGKIVNL